jgi:hypothetical protein
MISPNWDKDFLVALFSMLKLLALKRLYGKTRNFSFSKNYERGALANQTIYLLDDWINGKLVEAYIIYDVVDKTTELVDIKEQADLFFNMTTTDNAVAFLIQPYHLGQMYTCFAGTIRGTTGWEFIHRVRTKEIPWKEII